tara:strand:- start:955 stop:1620 length:666 start_codon:yes stop_codon:yes gene_type:complete
MKKLIVTTAACIAASIVINTHAAPNQPVRPAPPVSTPGLTQAVDQWAKDIKKALGAFRNVNTAWQQKILEFDSINAKLRECAYKVRPGGELDTLAQTTISLCLQRADETAKLAKDPDNDADIVAGYRAAEKTFRLQAGEIRKILDSIHDMHKHFVKYQEKVTKYRKYYIVMMTARETVMATKALDSVEKDMNYVLGLLNELKAKPAEINEAAGVKVAKDAK